MSTFNSLCRGLWRCCCLCIRPSFFNEEGNDTAKGDGKATPLNDGDDMAPTASSTTEKGDSKAFSFSRSSSSSSSIISLEVDKNENEYCNNTKYDWYAVEIAQEGKEKILNELYAMSVDTLQLALKMETSLFTLKEDEYENHEDILNSIVINYQTAIKNSNPNERASIINQYEAKKVHYLGYMDFNYEKQRKTLLLKARESSGYKEKKVLLAKALTLSYSLKTIRHMKNDIIYLYKEKDSLL